MGAGSPEGHEVALCDGAWGNLCRGPRHRAFLGENRALELLEPEGMMKTTFQSVFTISVLIIKGGSKADSTSSIGGIQVVDSTNRKSRSEHVTWD